MFTFLWFFSPPLPSGFTLRSLDKDAAYINTFNDHQPFVDDNTINHHVRDFVTYLPSAGIFQDDLGGNGKLVAYALCKDNGGIGKLYVLPEFRRQGFASRLIVHLSRRLTDEGYLNKCYIDAYVTNERAIACFKRLGFTEIQNSGVKWFTIDDLKVNWKAIKMWLYQWGIVAKYARNIREKYSKNRCCYFCANEFAFVYSQRKICHDYLRSCLYIRRLCRGLYIFPAE